MTDRHVILSGGLVGAVAGMLAGFVFFTAKGQRWRVDAERNLGTMLGEAERLLSAADQVRQSVADLRGGTTDYPRSA